MFKLSFIFMMLFISSLSASEVEIYGEYGSYNIAYEDKNQIIGYNKYSFPTSITTLGGWYKGKFDKDYDEVWGLGIVNNRISYAKKTIYKDEILIQNEKKIFVPYIFIGKDCYYWGLEVGVSWYLTTEVHKAREYYNGTHKEDQSWGLRRSESHTIPNFNIRILPKNWFHLNIFMSRGNFSAIDSLLGVNFLLPRKNFIYGVEISLLTPKEYLADDKFSVALKSNQRVKFSLEYKNINFKAGVNLGIIVKNGITGVGHIKILNRLSLGTNISLNW